MAKLVRDFPAARREGQHHTGFHVLDITPCATLSIGIDDADKACRHHVLNAVPVIMTLDLFLAAALHETATPPRIALWTAVTGLGRLPIVAIPGFALALWLVRERRSWLPLAGLIASLTSARDCCDSR